jgi:hypothetical protein
MKPAPACILGALALVAALGGGPAGAQGEAAAAAPASAASPGAAAQAPGLAPPSALPAKDERALAVLRRTSEALARMRSFAFSVRSLQPVAVPGGQWASLVGRYRVSVKRPDRLYVDQGGDLFPQRIYCDGKRVTFWSPDRKVYAQEAAPPTLDALLARFPGSGEQSLPFADVLLASPWSAWEKEMLRAVYVGESASLAGALDHVAVTSEGVDWQLWVDRNDRLPRLVLAVHTSVPRSPVVMVEFSDWKADPQLPASTFAFEPPKGATRIEFRSPAAEAAR